MNRPPISLLALAALLTGMVLLSGCSKSIDDPFHHDATNSGLDDRTAVIALQFNTRDAGDGVLTSSLATGCALYTSGNWGPIRTCEVVGIRNSLMWVNGVRMYDNGYPYSYNDTLYQSAEPLPLPADGEVDIRLILSSLDNVYLHYYPEFESTLTLPPFDFEGPEAGAAFALGDSLHFAWSRHLDNPDGSGRWGDRLALTAFYINSGGVVVQRDSLNLEPVEDTEKPGWAGVNYGIESSGPDVRSLRVSLILVAGEVDGRQKIVKGKEARLSLSETRQIVRHYLLQR